jgi:hypothetical protein
MTFEEPFHLYDVVALLDDLPEHRLVRGQVGTIVMVHRPDVYEVEFTDNDGHTYAMLALSSQHMMLLHHGPVTAA